MTAGELIEALQRFDPSTRVFIDGYEGGAEDMVEVRPVIIAINYNPDPAKTLVWGIHEVMSEVDDNPSFEVVQGIYLPRREHVNR